MRLVDIRVAIRTLLLWCCAIALLLASAPVVTRVAAQAPSPAPPAGPAPETPAPAPAPSEATPDPNAVTAPKLLAFVEAGFPEEAKVQQIREASVTLLITIAADGSVEAVTPSGTPAGYGFDELALSAAKRFVFEPAKKGGVPMRARIQYRYDFQLPEPAPPATPSAAAEPPAAPAAPAPGSFELKLFDADEDEPLAKAELIITSPRDPSFSLRLVSDDKGKLSSGDLPPGTYQLRAHKDAFGDEVHGEEIVSGQVTELTYRLSKLNSYEGEYGAVARVKAPPREVTRRTIERAVLTRVAGTRGDALRTIELLPGVGRPPFGSGQVLIRGSAPQDSTVLLDGVYVPLLYHFGGLTSFINSRALERIDFYPGNFSVKYGRRMGGVIDVGTRDPATDGYHGVLDVNVPLDSSLLVEGPLGKKASFLVAGRRSYFGEIVSAVIPEGTLDAFAAPVYNDYQLFVVYKPTDKDRLRLSAYGSSDRLEVLFADAPDDAPSIRGIELGTRFDRQQLGWAHQYTPKVDHILEFSVGRDKTEFQLGPDLYFNFLSNELYLRGEVRYRPNAKLGLAFGTDSLMNFYEVSYLGPEQDRDEGGAGGGSLESRELVRFKQKGNGYQPSLYVEALWLPTKHLRLTPGFRVDYNGFNNEFTYDPRISGRYTFNDHWSVKAGVGLFSQPPQPQQTAPGLGNPQLLSMRSIHAGAGVDHNFSKDFSLGVEGFYKRIFDRVVATPSGEPPFTNEGLGRVYGMEVAGRKSATGKWFGFLSYTLMWSERKDPSDPWRPFDYDQRHIFTLAASYRLPRGWEIGGTFRVVTGNPRTPYENVGTYNIDTQTYVATIGRINSVRNPTFNRLDLRVQKTWTFDSWRLSWYLDVQNVYNAKNPEGVTYSFDYSQRGNIRGLPIIPVLGLRGEI
jgi:TonB family protein